jgi:hypothetical protein
MSWEIRNGRRCYTRTIKANGRIYRQYVGFGSKGEQAAAEDLKRRVEREAQAKARKDRITAIDQAQTPAREFWDLTELIAQAALVAAGYHQHAKGEWRKRHHAQPNPTPNQPR